MNISLQWVFDHLEGSYNGCDIPDLLQKIGTRVTEIESAKTITLNLDKFTLIKVEAVEDNFLKCFSAELNQHMLLPLRSDLELGNFGLCYHDTSWQWATAAECGGEGSALIPALYCAEAQQSGDWKKSITTCDTLLSISNTALTHRPDLWGHRGFAREIGALLGLKMIPQESLIAPLAEKLYSENIDSTPDFPFSIKIADKTLCSKFSAFYVKQINNVASLPAVAFRLLQIGSHPINAIVDLTNYGMFDWGHPSHAFDAERIGSAMRVEQNEEPVEVELLDKSSKVIPAGALVIKNNQILSVAGIIGGAQSAINKQTTSALFEAAWFDPKQIRATSTHLHIRTEASTRFEKELDAQQTNLVLKRIAFLAKEWDLFNQTSSLMYTGATPLTKKIVVAHSFIEKILGINIFSSFVIKTLSNLGFGIFDEEDKTYQISVPSWRSKDVSLPADIAEEIARFYGFENFPLELPSLALAPHSRQHYTEMQLIKEYCAYSALMHEVVRYPLFNEEFLQKIQWQPSPSIALKNPVAQTAKFLVNSLIPGLVESILENSDQHEHIFNFFQLSPIWQMKDNNVIEENSLAGIFFDRNNELDFYRYKEVLNKLFIILKRPLSWHKVTTLEQQPWFHPYKTAQLQHNDQIIGYAGMAHPKFLSNVTTGSAFIFELKRDALLNLPTQEIKFTPETKYPDSWLDISLLIPTSLTIAALEQAIKNVDTRINKVSLQDIFHKDEWLDKRSVLIRFFIRDPNHTLTKQEIGVVGQGVHQALEGIGAIVR